MTLHMSRLEILTDKLMSIGLKKKIPLQDMDTGYLVHCQLAELFGAAAPKPFFIDECMGRKLIVLGYSDHCHEALAETARSQSDELSDAVVWSEFTSKHMPVDWRPGMKLSFSARACPIVRTKQAGPHNKRNRGGLEVDAFIHACWRAGPNERVDREKVYGQWLAKQLEGGGATLLDARISAFQRTRLSRRNHEVQRRSRACERPDVMFEGVIQVANPANFNLLLRRGIGRHRAFGFGMLRLRPV